MRDARPTPPRRNDRATWWAAPPVWIALGVLCLAVDYATGPAIQFPVVSLAPIGLAAWYGGRHWGYAMALALALGRVAFRFGWDAPSTVIETLVNTGIRLATFGAFAYLTDRLSRQIDALRRLSVLETIAGVCGVCKKIRDVSDDAWHSLDAYVAMHPEGFHRDVCPSCASIARQVLDRR